MMALTATATQKVRLYVSKCLGMLDPFVMPLPPCKSNVLFEVKRFESLETDLKFVLSDIYIQTE